MIQGNLLLTGISQTTELWILKYLLLDDALRSVREGLGSYTTLMVG